MTTAGVPIAARLSATVTIPFFFPALDCMFPYPPTNGLVTIHVHVDIEIEIVMPSRFSSIKISELNCAAFF